MSTLISSSNSLIRSAPGISTNKIMTTVPMRFQSSFTFLNNHNLILKRQSKQNKRRTKRLSPTVTTTSKYHQHTPFTDLSAGSNDPKVLAGLSKKYKLYSLPRVPSTRHLDRESINLSALYSGYRPMFFNPKHLDASNNTNTSTLYEFSMNLEEPNSMWYNSAAGLETFNEWDNIPTSVMKDLKPFVPPAPNNKTSPVVNETLTQEEKPMLTKLQADPAALLEQVSGLLQKKRGRKKPLFTLIHTKKYPHN
ncbi:similar to Saccharomyces cerevisiae YPL159C PET20 Mitochondrial protein, required for respiratory growth under some conditions and for stability of the mitochondrial genome [Maudiozyma saulgeensis]|uniref:Similar to Saccharomyces cerevisiae YPL159C PET20 Mitochondrial protein, required for respiratory growth under some conditions and for stability of the mitochondrial genome n=1 Tax=Maudiozyma saulgeensis TaxID=1789683 RepID=A0A1X7R9I2_9SACH|nr:similar to Saccharomyces cerevisiae YPL159C PET20 Mitochondrial protein, required for respiratory growth under some conditions and for stability of the mitochondrial genome [Kazachstania saulgeensis]